MSAPTPAEAVAAFDELDKKHQRVAFETLFRIVRLRHTHIDWDAILHPDRPTRGLTDAEIDDLIASLDSGDEGADQ